MDVGVRVAIATRSGRVTLSSEAPAKRLGVEYSR
jgi:hypothetical protein